MSRILVFTGYGKGKTTSAIGCAIRALGNDKKVMFVSFMKYGNSGEHIFLSNLKNPNFEYCRYDFNPQDPLTFPLVDPQDYNNVFEQNDSKLMVDCSYGLEVAKTGITSGEFDLVILDEINIAMTCGLVPTNSVVTILKNRYEHTSVILTGREAPESILKMADTITEMVEIEHPYCYSEDLACIEGIEY